MRENVEITDSNSPLDFNLKVGAVSETVTVTAQRQEENLQDVPISVRAFSGREIENRLFTDTIDALQAAPNINAVPLRPHMIFKIAEKEFGEMQAVGFAGQRWCRRY